ncbi:MAG: tail-specific protease [Chlorobi bacterium]|nr:tail-specific protease [Chlorobiota bacterium]
MFRKSLLSILLALGIALPLTARTPVKSAPAQAFVPLAPTAAQEEAGLYIRQFLLKNHFRKVTPGDSLSMEIFNRYIDILDGSKSYFMAGEVDSLRHLYGNRFDDELLSGKADAGFAIYNFFLKRAQEKAEYMKAALNTARFSFSAPDTLDIDRKKDPWPSDRKQLTDLWTKELKYQWLSLKSSGEPAIGKELSKNLTSRLNLLKRQNAEDVYRVYSSALTTSFDPHTGYFSPEEFENFQIDLSRSLEGIGAKLQSENEYIVVNEVIPGGPAFKSRLLKKGDKIIGVGQGNAPSMVDVTGWRINDVVRLIRGQKGSVVRLKLLPASQGGRGPSRIIRLVRDKINLEEEAAHKQILPINGKKIGVITVPSFYLDFDAQKKHADNYNSTSRDINRIIGELKAARVEGIVLDLRDNGGGSLEEAVKVAGLFIPQGPVVQISGGQGSISVLGDEDPRTQYDGPLAVLVNRYSASASEIVAAAIQDYKRGVIIGERTFGKGTVQTLINLPAPSMPTPNGKGLGEIKLTVAKFYRISGGSTQHKGVVPDIFMPSMIDSTTIGEDTYSSSLPWTTIPPSGYQPTGEVSQTSILTLRQKDLDRSAKNAQFRAYLRDLDVLDGIRRKKGAVLQEIPFKQEAEVIKKIENQWEPGRESSKNRRNDVLLNAAASVVADLGRIGPVLSQPGR